MDLKVNRWLAFTDERDDPDGGEPLRKVAVVAVIANPYAGRYVADLDPLIRASAGLGERMAEKAADAMRPLQARGYGKGGVVGLNGEQEHANALLTTTFAAPLRARIGGGKAWIPSMTKRAAPGAEIDIPVAHKDALYVRSHYDGITITLPDAPLPDEIAIICAYANRGRPNHRVGGLAARDIKGLDGLT